MDDRATIGHTEPMIPAAATTDRRRSATDGRQGRGDADHPPKRDPDHPQGEARREATHRLRRRLFDLLFEEVDAVPGIPPAAKARLKQNLRAHIAHESGGDDLPAAATLAAIEAALPHPDTAPDAAHDAAHQGPATSGRGQNPADNGPADQGAPPADKRGGETGAPDLDRLAAAATTSADGTAGTADDNVNLARQFRACLALNTDTARKVALYLDLLLKLGGGFEPHLVIEL